MLADAAEHAPAVQHGQHDVQQNKIRLLRAKLLDRLAAVCGDNISAISLEFEEPEEITSPVTFESAAYDPVFDTAQAALPHAAIVSTAAPEPEANSEITLDMSTFHAPETGKEE